jgi:hypothetical protein
MPDGTQWNGAGSERCSAAQHAREPRSRRLAARQHRTTGREIGSSVLLPDRPSRRADRIRALLPPHENRRSVRHVGHLIGALVVLGCGGLRPAARRAAPRQDCGHDFHRIAFQTVGLLPTLAPVERMDAVGINTARPAPRLEPQRKAGRCGRGMVRAQSRPLPTTSR